MSEARLSEVERRLEKQRRLLRELDARVSEALQQFPRAWQQSPGSGGGSTALRWCRVPTGGSGAATGTWPTLTQASFTSDVYENASGTLTLVASAATIYWKYLDAAAEGKIVPVALNADGSTYDAVLDSCTAVSPDV